ncbi:MAG: hypothetical protein LBU62_04165 [Bacteroidales bacterium]|jgi:hypothetical protein|nr:hypothetical protein [Bacteroidales bacterium]
MKKQSWLWIALLWVQSIAAQSPQELKSKLPAVKGWALSAEVETFDANSLFERINGAAPGYILFDFKELNVFVYQKTKSEDYITVQVYRHGSDINAFGIYASERPTETAFTKIGAEGYQEGAMLNFLVDKLYVKIESPSSDAVTVKAITKIAQDFAAKINPKAALPVKLLVFPAENKIAHSEQYIAQSFLGHEFLNNAFTADYKLGDNQYQLFVMDAGTTATAKAMLEKYFGFTKQTDALKEGQLIIQDKYNGDIACRWKGQHIWGVLNDNGVPVAIDHVLDAIEKKLH